MNDRKNRFISNRIHALRLVSPVVLALAAAMLYFAGAAGRPVCPDAPAARARLEEGAREYLRRTAEILGDRYNDAFYRTAMQTQIKRHTETVLRIESDPHVCFELLVEENETGAAEALAFLDEFGSGEVCIPADLFVSAESPADTLSERFFFSAPFGVSTPPSHAAEKGLPLPTEFLLLFSLASLLATALVPVSPLTAAGGGLAVIEEFFRRLTRCLFTHSNICHLVIPEGDDKLPPFSGHTSLEEKKCMVLLR